VADYDAIVIGSGSGGTTAALALARAGRRVAVYEQHYLPGGYGQSFSLKGYRFSPGIHYIGELGPGGALRHIYEGLGVANDVVFLELDPDGYDRVFVGDERFDIPKGLEPFRERLKQRFPSEARGIDGYFAIIERIGNELAWARPPANLVDAVKLPFRMRTTLRYGMQPLARFLDRFTREPYLRAILSIQAGDHGMAPSRAPTGLHAGLQTYYINGGCYPRGGGHAIVDAFVKQLRAHGGEIFLASEVTRILVENGRAIGVRLADGSEARADVVVANTDPGVTWGRLVDPEHLSARLRRRVARLRYSVSTISLFLAVDMDLRAAGLDSGNIWYSRTPDIDASYAFAERADISDIEEIPGLFFNVTTLKDPSMRTDGLHTVEAIAISSFDAFARWQDTKPGERGPEYARLKDYLAGKILDEIECFVPGFRNHVVFSALGTPLTNSRFIHATRGGIYGTENSLRNLGPFSFPVKTEIAGLFECGASTISPGIHGVTRSGLAAAAAALRCDESEFLTASGQSLRIYPADDPSAWPEELRPCVRRND
jgi:all-trans-retinol 13,14-reductase